MEFLIILISGLTLGSFANNAISALINKSKIDLFRSTCFCGEKKLKTMHLIPVLGYFILKGKCSFCDERISIRYLIVELTTVLIGLSLYYIHGFTLEFIIYFLLIYLLMIQAFVDLTAMIIPNIIVTGLIVVFILKTILFKDFNPVTLISAATFYFLFNIVNYLSLKLKKKLLIGNGDIKLLSALILFFGLPLGLLGLWISSLCATIGIFILKSFNKTLFDTKIPFGFYTGIGFFIISIFGSNIISYYSKIIDLMY